MTEPVKKKKMRKDYKFRFTKAELQREVYEALMWAADGITYKVPGDKSKPLVMGDPETLAHIVAVIVTEGLPEEDSSTSR
jgi:chaperone required for assembly of F1-ATPase